MQYSSILTILSSMAPPTRSQKHKFKQNLKHYRQVKTTIDVLQIIGDAAVNSFSADDTEAARKRIKTKPLNCVEKSLESLECVYDR